MLRIAGGITATAVVTLAVAACGGGTTTHTTRSATTSAVTSKAAAPTSATPSPNCYTPPPNLVADVDGTFTGGEHLEHTQAIDGPNHTVYIGGDIFDSSGQKVSSQDTWVEVEGFLYSITSDARRRTKAPDGRHLPFTDEWPDFNAELNECVGAAARAANGN